MAIDPPEGDNFRRPAALPAWLPDLAVTYLAHISGGASLRALARAKGQHPSSVLRQVRRMEAMRDDPLMDEALERIGARLQRTRQDHPPVAMEDVVTSKREPVEASDPRIAREARRILRRLCERDAFLAVAPDMPRAVVLRETVPGKTSRIAVLDREIAQAFALQDWIACTRRGRITCYGITTAGRAALKRLLAEDRAGQAAAPGMAEAPSPFLAQHAEMGERVVPMAGRADGQKLRTNLAESPLTILGRKKTPDGLPYLERGLIEAGERLREDFELAQMGPRIAQNWDRLLTGGGRGQSPSSGQGPAEGPAAARDRVMKALEALGPGLSDIAFRCCCFLEGMEAAERRLGWSARSGKVVLKIALQRLADHYGITHGAPERKAC